MAARDAAKSEPEPQPVPPAPAEVVSADIPAEIVAAIGAAIAMAEAETAAPAVAPVPSGATGSWVQSGRFREMGARTVGQDAGHESKAVSHHDKGDTVLR